MKQTYLSPVVITNRVGSEYGLTQGVSGIPIVNLPLPNFTLNQPGGILANIDAFLTPTFVLNRGDQYTVEVTLTSNNINYGGTIITTGGPVNYTYNNESFASGYVVDNGSQRVINASTVDVPTAIYQSNNQTLVLNNMDIGFVAVGSTNRSFVTVNNVSLESFKVTNVTTGQKACLGSCN